MISRYFPKKRDITFFQYKLLQIAVLLFLSLIIYIVYVIFDLERFEQKNGINEKPMNKEELRPQNIIKKYFTPENKKRMKN